jgi:hypothetical protein
MAVRHSGGKLYDAFTDFRVMLDDRTSVSGTVEGTSMVGIAIAMFIALFGWGGRYFGWDDPSGKIQLALGVCFILGVLSGYKVKGD